ncbi:MAG: hypothetical protein ISN29_01390 [Gammaproteobacteria bacterium AqS3]|nr:hypothetical protein [Gammaproteobacteria bacterium AqS3]
MQFSPAPVLYSVLCIASHTRFHSVRNRADWLRFGWESQAERRKSRWGERARIWQQAGEKIRSRFKYAGDYSEAVTLRPFPKSSRPETPRRRRIFIDRASSGCGGLGRRFAFKANFRRMGCGGAAKKPSRIMIMEGDS